MEIEKLREYQSLLIEWAKTAPVIQTFGMKLSYNENNQAIWDMPYLPKFDNAVGGIHGGVYATLLDNAGWFTVCPHYGFWVATVEYQTRLLDPVEKQDLQAVGKVIRLGRRLSTAQMELRTKSDQLVAVGSGTFTVTSIPLPTST
ncbi:MAG: PaaI family thioesterase [Bdellovibrionales bacterium]|nr:PaaI family thioesterase [Bdellovibrionales bacterium]